MPGRGSYGPGGKWIYQRAARLRSKNPDMEESTSFAVATQQAHKVKKSPKKFRTAEGVRTAKAKMTGPIKEYRKTASLAGFFDELEKIANIGRIAAESVAHARKMKAARPLIMSRYGKMGGSARKAAPKATGRVSSFLARLAA